jgi:hypothetical protein
MDVRVRPAAADRCKQRRRGALAAVGQRHQLQLVAGADSRPAAA